MNPEIKRQQAEDALRVKEALAKSANLRNIALESLEQQKALVNGIKKIPESQILDQAQQLEHKILPAALEKFNGDIENENYKYWRGVLDSLNWALHVVDYSIRLEEKITRIKHRLSYEQNLNLKLERELEQYTTMDRFITTELITDYTQNK
jgi:hypothetical protein